MSRLGACTLLAALLVAACGADTATEDPEAPMCSGVSGNTLEAESTPAGACPAAGKAMVLTGTGSEGAPCSDSTDCAPTCCSCPGTGGGADVAECNNGSCLSGDTACCLFAETCTQ